MNSIFIHYIIRIGRRRANENRSITKNHGTASVNILGHEQIQKIFPTANGATKTIHLFASVFMKENWNLIFGARLKPRRNLLLIRCLLILRSSEELASSPAFVTWSILIKKSQHLTEASLCPSVLPELTYSPFIYFSRSLCVYHLTSLPLLHSFPLLHFPSFRPCAVPPLLLLSFYHHIFLTLALLCSRALCLRFLLSDSHWIPLFLLHISLFAASLYHFQ